MKISGTEFDSCVELHNEASCGGGFTQFRPGHLYLHDLWFWGMQGQDIAVYAQAVSRCGVYCNKTVPEIKAETDLDKSPGQNMITIYDYKGYYGMISWSISKTFLFHDFLIFFQVIPPTFS
jgi:hypothetical protein